MRDGRGGSETSTRISSIARSVVIKPMKKSSAATVRAPFGLRKVNRAPEATAITGSSPEGSA